MFIALGSYLEYQQSLDQDQDDLLDLDVADGDDLLAEMIEMDEQDRSEVDRLIELIKTDKSAVERNVHRVPAAVRDYVTGEDFLEQTVARFNAIDEDGNGVLTPDELFPIIEDMISCPWAVTMDHCTKFLDIFDENGDGVISVTEVRGAKSAAGDGVSAPARFPHSALSPLPALPCHPGRASSSPPASAFAPPPVSRLLYLHRAHLVPRERLRGR